MILSIMDYYQILGVNRNATDSDIKNAYRKLASKHHPDRGGDTAEFQKIQQAYDVLSDRQKRAEYDQPQGGPGGFPGGNPGFHFNVNGFDMGDIFGQFFGQGPRHPFHQHNQKPVYRAQVFVTLEQVYSGGEMPLKLQTPKGLHAVSISIPIGVPDGGQIKYDDLIPDSQLVIEFRTHHHLKFERQGSDLYCQHRISVLDLIVGTTIEVPTIKGNALQIIVPPNTPPYGTLKATGQGLPTMNTQHCGDQYIIIKPFIPDNIDVSVINAIKNSRN